MKRRAIVFLMALILVTGMAQLGVTTALAADAWDGTTASTSWYDSSPDATAFTINTGAELAGLALLVNTGDAFTPGGTRFDFSGVTITLGDDIDLVGHSWTPIGDGAGYFSGTFDGAGHTISNLAIGTPASPSTLMYIGLYGFTYASIQNLNVQTTGIYSSCNSACVGVLAGDALGNITNCTVAGNVTSGGDYNYVGGLTGASEGNIQDCSSGGDVACGTSSYVGGLTGASQGDIQSCSAGGDVVCGTGSYAGGLVGYKTMGGVVTGCYAAGNVSDNATNDSFLGGLVGYTGTGALSNCYATGDVSCSGPYGGGFTGYIDSTVSSVSGCYATGDVTASGGGGACIGGFVGYTGHALDSCFAIGNVTSTGDGTSGNHVYVGGFVGYSEHTITRCFASGNVTNSGSLVDIGGFVGHTESGTIGDCYAAGSVSGGNQGDCLAGGFAGSNARNIQTSYARGAVSGSGTDTCVGGFAGNNGSGATLRFCYFDTNDSGLTGGIGLDANSQTVTGLAPVQMTGSAASGNMTALDFTAIWTAKANDLKWYFPQLKVFAESTDSTVKSASLASVTITPFTVTFDSGSGSAVAPEYGYYTAVGTPADPTRPNYSFEGWYTTSGLTSAYDFSMAVTADITLFAKWKINSFTLGYDANGGSGTAPASVTQDYNTTVAAASGSGLGRANYTFSGWNTKADGSGTAYAAGAVFTFTGNTTLYAQWQYSGFNITAAASSANGSVSGSGTYGAGASVTLTATANAGYYFAGWYEGGVLVSASPAYTFTVSGARSLTAQFDSVGIPASISATAASYNKINISWAAVPGAKGYQLYRAESPSGEYKMVKTLSKTGYADSGLKTGTTYYYKVKAYVKIGSKKVYGSYFSPASSATPVLGAVTGPGVKVYDPAAAKITWKAVAGASKYEVWRSVSPDGGFAFVKAVGGRAYRDSNLTPNTMYYYRIRAYRMVGRVKVYGEYSAVVSAKPVLAQVTGSKAVGAGASGIKLSWRSVAGKTKYEIWTSDKSDGTYTLLAETASTGFKHKNLTAGVTYYYKVRAYRLAGGVKVYGDYSPAVSAAP